MEGCIDHGCQGTLHRYSSCYYRGKYIDKHVRALLRKEPRPSAEMQALHRCDNMRCINPEHLYWGTRVQNIRDTMGKPGSRVFTRVVDDAEVVAIRTMEGSQREIAERMGISRMAVQQIKAGTRRCTARST